MKKTSIFIQVFLGLFFWGWAQIETEQTSYAFRKVVPLEFDAAIQKTKSVLKKEGFGVLTEIDVKKTLKKKLNVDISPYIILGACNPPNAYKSIQAEPEIGLMLPCNVIVYVNEDGKTVVAAIDPLASMMAIKNPKLSKVAALVQAKLKRVINNI
jgi:uncharacterized protein (DUF302 family)